MRKLPHEAALDAMENADEDSVEEVTPFCRERAVVFLRIFTGQDCGDDVSAWKDWFAEHSSEEYLESCYDRIERFNKRWRDLKRGKPAGEG